VFKYKRVSVFEVEKLAGGENSSMGKKMKSLEKEIS